MGNGVVEYQAVNQELNGANSLKQVADQYAEPTQQLKGTVQKLGNYVNTEIEKTAFKVSFSKTC